MPPIVCASVAPSRESFACQVTCPTQDFEYIQRLVRLRLQACAGLLPLAALGCGGAASVPATPDLQSLIASYNTPDGVLDGTRAAQVIANAPLMPELAAGLRATGIIADDVNTASTDSSPHSGTGVQLQGSVQLDFRCPGELDQPDYDPSVNGSASLTIAVQNSLIKRTFGGSANACVLRGYVGTHAVRVQLDGTIAFDLGHDIGIGQRWSGRLLAYIPGEIDIEGYTLRSISARFTPDMLEHLVVLDDGTTVVLVFTDSGLTVRDKDGTWVCPTGQSTCTQQ